jgi:UDP-sulfoquinovose synthase
MILGGDGYLGWPTAMALCNRGHDVCVMDNYLRRNLARETCSESLLPNPNLHDRVEIFQAASNHKITAVIGDCARLDALEQAFVDFGPDAVVHYAEQPSGPYSMMGAREAQLTLNNNLNATFNLIWAVLKHNKACHIVKLGTMGEYGVPNIDIEEGWIEIEHKGRKDKFLFPRQAGTLYHTTKVLDTDLLWFYVRAYGLRVTDLMQGPVYGLHTAETAADERLLPNFHYDDIFGTVVNRFLVQAIAGVPLTVYGKGGQTRGYLNLKDTLQCIQLAIEKPAAQGELRVFNQFTEQFTVNQLAEKIAGVGNRMGLKVEVKAIPNPRKEKGSTTTTPVTAG